ncbi:hypothetical protein [Sulfurovum sp. AR]|uniref:hypothetical protein n=1 Tax=Sulfurovum sp. AR TaxID=1165841 RepID=UPI00025C4CE4|nr:hypothetical protein [Sulfurovum sp. AR]EIF51086.1 hypothetical protein SULAR_06953 [Sulfurovum sp. AR]
MKKVEVVKADDVEVKPFILDDFIQYRVQHSMMNKITKKELKHLADELGLVYDDTQIVFTKKLLNAYLLGK